MIDSHVHKLVHNRLSDSIAGQASSAEFALKMLQTILCHPLRLLETNFRLRLSKRTATRLQ